MKKRLSIVLVVLLLAMTLVFTVYLSRKVDTKKINFCNHFS